MDAVPCRAVPCRAVPCRAVPCRAVPCRAVPCRAVLCCASGVTGIAGCSGYAASKHAVVGLMRSAAAEYGPKGLRINCINPGAVGECGRAQHSTAQHSTAQSAICSGLLKNRAINFAIKPYFPGKPSSIPHYNTIYRYNITAVILQLNYTGIVYQVV